jgi:hypothetical protein
VTTTPAVEPAMATPTGRTKPRRPFGVVVLVFIHLAFAALGIAAVTGIADARPGSGTADLLEVLGDLGPLFAGASVVALIVAFGLWRLDRWAWYLAMVWTGLGLAFQILLYLGNHQSYIHMLIYVIEAFYLNQREVKGVFQLKAVGIEAVDLEDDRTGPD